MIWLDAVPIPTMQYMDQRNATVGPTGLNPQRDNFFTQLPVMLVFVAAVVGILLVNRQHFDHHPQALASPPAPQARLIELKCSDCGEVVAVRMLGAPAIGNRSLLLNVRMLDGSLRTVRQPAPGFGVGDRVRVVDGTALSLRS